MGGSTNGFLHILALAHEADVAFTIDDMQRVGARVPIISNMSPHGKYHMCDHDAAPPMSLEPSPQPLLHHR